jgi:hypothetical protein
MARRYSPLSLHGLLRVSWINSSLARLSTVFLDPFEPDVRFRGEEGAEAGYLVSSQMTCTLARNEAGCGCVYPL